MVPSRAMSAPDSPDPGEHSEVTDRRVLRGRRNRDAIVDAVVELIEEGILSPTADQVATRAGVARRSVYHHFADMEELIRAVSDQHLATYLGYVHPVRTDGDFAARVAAFIEQRCGFAERLLHVYRASLLLAAQSPRIAEQIAAADAYLRDELRRTFAGEFRRAPGWTLDSLDLITSLEGWARLRFNQSLSVLRARRVVEESLRTLLEPHA